MQKAKRGHGSLLFGVDSSSGVRSPGGGLRGEVSGGRPRAAGWGSQDSLGPRQAGKRLSGGSFGAALVPRLS